MSASNQANEIFDQALRFASVEERAAFVSRACVGDEALRQRVERLLAAQEKAGAFLDEPAGGEPSTIRVQPVIEDGPGTSIGRYKLLEQIGQGGFGVVYVAEQREPVKRRVALKIIKLGMDTKQVVARFEAERQALALMDHPNIAKVLDAGATETGRPYFVMELVRGIRLTEYCDQNRLSTQERLELYIKVCQAIQHAHQKGIIHRDIKPSNILVTLHDGAPVPKVIDFGIAKATQGELTDKTVYTQFQQFIGTPAYMSPEQAEMSGLDIDTRSDIYSLGVLLYELLTGSTPFDAKELIASGVDAMRRTIREQEPVRPSTRVSSMQGEERTTTAQRRGLDAPKLIHLLRGDLDWIVMKCLEKDRTRRYETANGVAMDIQRHLNNEPVVACPPSTAYRFQKLVRRNKLAFAAAGAVTAALVIGLAVSAWMYLKENQAYQRAVAAEKAQARLRHEAEAARATEAKLREEAQVNEKKATTEAKKSQQVAQFLKEMLNGVGPSVALGRDTKMLREILDKTAERLGTDLKDQPEVELDLRDTIGEVYLDLGDYPRAEEVFRQALKITLEHLRDRDPQIAKEKCNLANVLVRESKFAEAEPLIRQVLENRERLEPVKPQLIAGALTSLAIIMLRPGSDAEAEALFREALAIRKRTLGEDHLDVINSLNNLAVALASQQRLAEAETAYRESSAITRKRLGNEHPNVALQLCNLANVMREEHKLAEAEQLAREALAIDQRVFENDHPQTGHALSTLGLILLEERQLDETERRFREALAIAVKRLGYASGITVEYLRLLTGVMIQSGKESEVAQLYEAAFAATIREPRINASLLQARGDSWARRGRWQDAVKDLAKAIELDASDFTLRHDLGPLLLQTGDVDGYLKHRRYAMARYAGTKDPVCAEQMAKDSSILPLGDEDAQTLRQWGDTVVSAGTNHWNWNWTWDLLAKGLVEFRQGNFAAAVIWMEQMFQSSKSVAMTEVPERDVIGWVVLAMAQHHVGRPAEARLALAKGLEISSTKLAKPDSSDFGEFWFDWIIAQTLLREARQLIADPSSDHSEPK